MVAWFHPFAGIAGDMALGALVDAGAQVDEVTSLLSRLPVDGWQVEAQQVMRGGLACTQLVVKAHDETTARTYKDILTILAAAGYPQRLAERAHAVFAALARAEGRLHGMAPEDVHFHEVGSLDTIIDVVGTCAALEVLGVDEVRSGPVTLGLGTVHAAHGRLPNPAPAVVKLLEGAPIAGTAIDAELTTPTGAALLAALCSHWGPAPGMVLRASGFGAGTMDLAGMPNATHVIIGELFSQAPTTPADHLGPHDHRRPALPGEGHDHRRPALPGEGHDPALSPENLVGTTG
ncbi:MAG: LarC family nickel insertion protein [Acidimicrobiales bacterium]